MGDQEGSFGTPRGPWELGSRKNYLSPFRKLTIEFVSIHGCSQDFFLGEEDFSKFAKNALF